MIQLTGNNLIGFQEPPGQGPTFTATDPVDGSELIPRFTEATDTEVDQAVQLAESAFQTYRYTSPEQRAAFLEEIASQIMDLGNTLIERCMLETALPEARLSGERMRTVNQLKLFASVVREGSWVGARIDHAQPERVPLPKPDIRQMQIALGPVGIFGASNFPLAFSVAGGDTASALAAGCTVVVKAHPLHPGTSELVGRAILKAARKTKMPEGVFSLIHGNSTQPGMSLVKHPLVRAIGFTGSFRGGKALFDAANARPGPIPVFAEMGSTNPVFILPGAMQQYGEKIAAGLAGSFTLGVGQFCTNPGVVLTLESESRNRFVKSLLKEAASIPAAHMLSSGIRNNFDNGINTLTSAGGVKQLTQTLPDESTTLASPWIFETSAENFLGNKTLGEEVFGPSTLLVNASGKEKMLEAAKSMSGNLTATIHGTQEDLREHAELVSVLERKVGRVIFNGFPTGVEVCHSMVHGGPYPATTNSATTSVGTAAIFRFCRPVCYQDFPDASLPEALREGNPLGILRMVDGEYTRS